MAGQAATQHDGLLARGSEHQREFEAKMPSDPAALLRLQRSVGNAAVVELIRRNSAIEYPNTAHPGPRPQIGIAAAVRRREATTAEDRGELTLRRVVTASSTLGPATGRESGNPADVVETSVAAASLKVSSVKLPAGIRPPTGIPGSQGRHTVAWAARVQEWARAFSGNLPDVLAEIQRRAVDDASFSETPEYEQVTEEARDLIGEFVLPESEWLTRVSNLIRDYVLAYQKSEFAAFKSTNPKGRGEADRLATLHAWSDWLKEGNTFSGNREEVVGVAKGLVDTHGNMDHRTRYKVIADWLRMLNVVFPDLFSKGVFTMPSARLVKSIYSAGLDAQHKVEAAMGGLTVEEPADDDVAMDHGPSMAVEEEEEEEEQTEADVEAAEQAKEDDELAEAGRQVDEIFDTSSYVASVSLLPSGAEPADDSGLKFDPRELRVRRLDIANERALTQFGRTQGNHVMPWSMERVVWSKEFVGKSLYSVLETIASRAAVLQGGTLGPVPTDKRTVGAWKTILDRSVEGLLTLDQASKAATYGVEADATGKSTPSGHGEAPALAWLDRVERALSVPGAKAQDVAAASEVKTRFSALIDLPQLDSTRLRMGWQSADALAKVKTEWKRKLAVILPKTTEAFSSAADEAFDSAEAPKDYFLVVNERAHLEEKIRQLEAAQGNTQRRSNRRATTATTRKSTEESPLERARLDLNVLLGWWSVITPERMRPFAVRRAKQLRDERRKNESAPVKRDLDPDADTNPLANADPASTTTPTTNPAKKRRR